MPIYEYRCSNCHRVFEEWCKQVEEADVKHACPVCNAEAKRLMSNTSFALKGGGWYATDYGSQKTNSTCNKSCVAANDCPAATQSSETNSTSIKDSPACAGCTPA